MERQRSQRCLTCGSKSHRTTACPRSKHRGRSPTPHSRGKYVPRQKVNFSVSALDDPEASGREGDVTDADEEAVEAYMAARSIAHYASGSDKE